MGYFPWSNHSSGVGALTAGEQQSEELALLASALEDGDSLVVERRVSVPRLSAVDEEK